MSDETFHQLLHFCEAAQPYVVMLTGGEPTEHPLWADYARELLRLPSVKVMAILTNGAWIEDSKTRITMAKLIRSQKGRVQVQVDTWELFEKPTLQSRIMTATAGRWA